MAEFMEGLDTTRMSGAMEHAAENLSLIYAGGCMAIDAGILPYQKSDVLRAVERCFRDALQTAAEESDPLLRAKRLLCRHLESNRIFEMKSPNDRFDASRFDGYVAKDGGRWRYVIRAASLRDWFKTEPGAARGIVAWLQEKGCLLARQPRPTKGADRPTDWAERTLVWPDRQPTSVRSISLLRSLCEIGARMDGADAPDFVGPVSPTSQSAFGLIHRRRRCAQARNCRAGASCRGIVRPLPGQCNSLFPLQRRRRPTSPIRIGAGAAAAHRARRAVVAAPGEIARRSAARSAGTEALEDEYHARAN